MSLQRAYLAMNPNLTAEQKQRLDKLMADGEAERMKFVQDTFEEMAKSDPQGARLFLSNALAVIAAI